MPRQHSNEADVLPSLSRIGGASSANARVSWPGLSLWFSYGQLMAFSRQGRRYVRQNRWGTTTGRCLNDADGGSAAAKKARLDDAAFLAAWRKEMKSFLAKPCVWTGFAAEE